MIISVQFLRAIAALFVVISHISLKGLQYNINSFQWFHIGGSGVDLFLLYPALLCVIQHIIGISVSLNLYLHAVSVFCHCIGLLHYWL